MSEIIGKSFDGDDMRIPLSDVARFLNDAGVEIDPATIQLADDQRNSISERAILDIVQSMAEESLSPDNFEGLILALEELKRNRSIDSNYVSDDPRKAMLDELATLREQVKVLREALDDAVRHLDWIGYGDSYERECARESGLIDRLDDVLEQTKSKDGE